MLNYMKHLFFALLLLPQLAYSQFRSDCFSLDLSGGSSIAKIDETFVRDTTLNFSEKIRISGLSISGISTLNNDNDSYIKVTLVDDFDYEFLVYENYPLLSGNLSTGFVNVALETIALEGVTPQYIKISIKNASLKLEDINYIEASVNKNHNSQLPVDIHKKQSQYIVEKLNSNIKKRNITWHAGVTSISEKSYSEKKDMFGGTVPELYGLEYYVGGIFIIPSSQNTYRVSGVNMRNSTYVSEWDWRNRHGKNWMTSVKDQGSCGSCWAHAAVGVLEAYINLYYNDTLNYDLSEKEIISCSPYIGYEQYAYDYIKSFGIVDEDCFQFIGCRGDCNLKCPNPYERVFIEDYGNYVTIEDSMKQQLFKAPITIGLSTWVHSMAMAGYKTIIAGDTIYNGNSSSKDTIVINPISHANLIGKTAWLMKNSWGQDWGDDGYGYFVFDPSIINSNCFLYGSISSLVLSDNDIVCSDADGDGLYFWGVGSKPAHCPSWVPDIPDGDDSNIGYGSLDSYGNLEVLPPGITINTPVTYSSNSSTTYRLGIVNGGSLTISGTTTLTGDSKIRICEGGVLIVDGGVLQNADIALVPGSTIIVRNNGKIYMATGKSFEAPTGVVVNIERGEIH